MTSTAQARVHLRVHGRVQGVFFRASTQREAQRLSLSGWVRNCADGGVEVIAEGPRRACEELVEYCRHGPMGARVDALDVERIPATGEQSDFRILYR